VGYDSVNKDALLDLFVYAKTTARIVGQWDSEPFEVGSKGERGGFIARSSDIELRYASIWAFTENVKL
jgi:hypothetical protein